MTKYADAVRRALASRQMSIRALSLEVGRSYEHCRKIVQGAPVASQELNEAICRTLGLDESAMWLLARHQKAQERFGVQLPSEGVDQQTKVLFQTWEQLPAAERRVLIVVAEGLAARRRRHDLRRDRGAHYDGE